MHEIGVGEKGNLAKGILIYFPAINDNIHVWKQNDITIGIIIFVCPSNNDKIHFLKTNQLYCMMKERESEQGLQTFNKFKKDLKLFNCLGRGRMLHVSRVISHKLRHPPVKRISSMMIWQDRYCSQLSYRGLSLPWQWQKSRTK